MRTLALVALLLIQPCFVRADWPYAEEAPAKAWPFTEKPCDCNPCTCNPLDCNCPGCATGCKGRSGASATTADVVSFVGVDPMFQAQASPPIPIGPPATGKKTVHKQTVSICDGLNCTNQEVDVPDGYCLVPVASTGNVVGTAANCATCGNQGVMMMSSGDMGSAPVRRGIFRRGGRRAGGCASCGG